MILTQLFLSLGKLARGLNKQAVYFTKPVEKIIIHWIGPYPNHTLGGVRSWWEKGSNGEGVQASAHFIIKEEYALQCLPLNEVGWHSGDARNNSSIGIEVVPMNLTGEFSQKTIETLKELIQYIRKETGRNLELERHYDGVQKKDCPRFYTPVTSLLDGGGRVNNPEGGDQRWEELKQFLNAA
ncbi:MAG: peptidoglycan recognition protein family protein [Treponema sp.]|nr:peptidoglycan recognition protein family protein [Treponema sp.]